MNELGVILRQRRESLKLKQKGVADQSGVSSAYLNKVEKGETVPTPAFLSKIADVLHLDFVDLYIASLEEKQAPAVLLDAMREYRAVRPLLAAGMPLDRFRSMTRSLSGRHVEQILLIVESIALMIHEVEGTAAQRIPGSFMDELE
ncbi:helix-turn-helix transcriptional regulator [bacterium]|nr:helix-turn-helix transcriptional regulator [candidate division CSSED10-310 bacterium]